MRRILQCLDEKPEVEEALQNYKQVALETMVAQIAPTTTLTELATLMGFSHEWVRERLVKNPEYAKDLYKINRRYKIPRGVAVKFVKSIFEL